SEFVEVRFAENDGAGLPETLDHRRVSSCEVTLAHVRRGSRQLPSDVDQVLNGDRHPVKGPTVDATTTLLIRRASRGARGHGLGVDEGVGAGTVFGERGKAGFEAVDCGESQGRRSQRGAKVPEVERLSEADWIG